MTKQTYPSSLPYPFSAAVRTGKPDGPGLLFVSGQVGVRDGKTGDGIEEQTRFTMENIRDVLTQAGATLNDVVKMTVFITDMSVWSRMNEVYRSFFTKDLPARSALGVTALALPDLLVEIECVAAVD
ncbi:MAG: RidA family protein [Dehalococcoidia bacterium]